MSGQVVSDNQYIKHGAFHTLELEAPRKFTITKDLWDSIALQMVDEACSEKSTADLAAVVMEMGLAHVCLVTKSMSVTKAKIELSVPRKRPGSTQHEKQRDKFFEYVLQALVQHIDWSVVKAVIVASPGFVKDQFMEYLVAQVGKRDLPQVAENKDRFVKARCSSGHKHSLKEVLQDVSIMEQLKVSLLIVCTFLSFSFFQSVLSTGRKGCGGSGGAAALLRDLQHGRVAGRVRAAARAGGRRGGGSGRAAAHKRALPRRRRGAAQGVRGAHGERAGQGAQRERDLLILFF